MIIKSFIFTGLVCAFAQIIKDNTKYTSGHITSLFVVVGVILSFFDVYDKLIEYFGGGASVVIMSFGNTLYKYGLKYGILNMLGGASIGITASVLMAFLITVIYKVKD